MAAAVVAPVPAERAPASAAADGGELSPLTAKKGHRSNDLVREIKVQSAWAGQLQSYAPAPISRQPLPEREVILVDNVFAEDECVALLGKAEEHGFGATDYPKEYRGNLRLQVIDLSLAEAVWDRLRPLVPAVVHLRDCAGAAADLSCVWDAVGLNECWRLSKYYPGDRFMTHCDACFQRSRDERSMFTVNIYMNDVDGGGATRFYFSLDDDDEKVDLTVKPRAGSCLIFRQPPGQSYVHDGEELQSGLKYLFRSDVMYRRRDRNDTLSDSEIAMI